MKRMTLAVLVLLSEVGCDDPSVDLLVQNQGQARVRICADWTDTVEDYDSEGNYLGSHQVPRTSTWELAAGEIRRVTYPTDYLTVRIERISDGLVLYEEHLSPGHIEREHGTVEIVVHP